MTSAKRVTAAMLVIGNEVLSGRTQDENLQFIGNRLTELGIELREARVIPDDEAMIVSAVNQARAAYDYVFTSGGIGPTHDDITADCIAKAFGRSIDHHPDAVAVLKANYPARILNEDRMRMARMPADVSLVPNPVSHAPGFRVENVYVFAGVPSVMRAMFECIVHELDGGDPVLSNTVAALLAEGALAAPLRRLQAQFKDVDIGSYPFYRRNQFGTSVVLRARDPHQLSEATVAYRAVIRELGAQPIESGEE